MADLVNLRPIYTLRRTLPTIVRQLTPEEREYDRYMAEVDAKRRRVAELQAELADLNQTLGQFEAEYHARVGTLFIELDRVNLAIAEYERRIARLKECPEAAPANVEEEVRSEFIADHQKVNDEEAQSRRYEQAYAREQQRPQLDDANAAKLRRLYRDLAKRHHPDLARTEAERRQRELTMQRINAAFQERNLAAMQALDQEATFDDQAFESRSIGEKLVWAIREVARLADLSSILEHRLEETRSSETHQLWQRQQSGEAIIATLAEGLRGRIAFRRNRLVELIATFRQVIEGRLS